MHNEHKVLVRNFRNFKKIIINMSVFIRFAKSNKKSLFWKSVTLKQVFYFDITLGLEKSSMKSKKMIRLGQGICVKNFQL